MLIIAIDGPSAAGKSTIANLISKKLNILHLDTGAMYRAFAVQIRQLNIDPDDKNKVLQALKTIDIKIKFEDNIQITCLNNRNINSKLRDHDISQIASTVSKYPEVRIKLVDMQQNLGKQMNLVVDGRDTTSFVFKDAKYKFYLTAEINTRAERRYKELMEADQEIDFETVLRDIIKRDEQDSNRDFAPLVKVPGAIIIDSTDLTAEEVVEKILFNITEYQEKIDSENNQK